MKNPLVVLGTVVVCCMTIPIIISLVSYKDIGTEAQTKKQAKKEKTTITQKIDKNIINYETVNKDSPVINIYNSTLGKVQQMDIETYLYGVISGEMPSEFDIEALKAQAVAARTFVTYKEKEGNPAQHSTAVVCTDFKHCQEYKSYETLKKTHGEEWIKNSYSKIKQAVDETKGQTITYNNEPILTLYFSTSSGKTENSEEVFSGKYPYLQSVDSPYDKSSPKYVSTLKISNKDFVSALKKSYSDIQINQNNLSSQIKIIEKSSGGSIKIMKVGNKEITGRDMRGIFGLNSANFEISFEDDYVDFVVKGYGHGVGMSQWGAEGMAQEGFQYYEILQHYYTGTKITDLY